MEVFNNLRRDNPYRPGTTINMDHQDLYAALGLNPKKHLPDAGLPPQKVGNVEVWVTEKIPGVSQDAKRVWCLCPHCGKMLTAGKFHQHRKVHK